MPVIVISHGPLFEPGKFQRVINDYRDAAEWKVARDGWVDLQMDMKAHFRTETPFYRTRVQIDNVGHRKVIDGDKVIYGAWLEGVGSRNFPKTRFKGYSHFRRVRQALNRKALRLAESVLPPYLERLR